MKSRKHWIFLLLLGVTCILAGCFLFIRNLKAEEKMAQNAASILQQLNIPSDVYDPYPLYLENPAMSMPMVTVDDYEYIGRLTLPTLGLSLPLMAEWDEERLEVTVCRYTGSLYQDNLIVCGSTYNCFFGRLRSLRIGDLVTVSDMDGHLFYYEVAEIGTAKKNVQDTVLSGDWDLTLFTSKSENSPREIIRCEKIK